MLKISSHFDGGNIEVVAQDSLENIQLEIRADRNSEFLQWFYYRVQGAVDQPLTMRLLNADKAAYLDGWDDYQAVASYDRQHWFRVPTRYEQGELVIEHTPSQNSIYYAYFAPYSYERHLDLIGWAQQSSLCSLVDLGSTIDGRDIELLQVGESADDKAVIWVTARQHPGETMAEWFIEGMLERLLDTNDATAKALLEQCVFYIVPNMNPDGAYRGHLRTNAVGVNLNREWMTPSEETSPEVFYVRQQMQKTGVNLYLDIHGDEGLPCNFIAGQEGMPVADEILQTENLFQKNLMAVNPDFQMERGYEPGKFGPESMTIASNWVGAEFGCPAMTLEMPFKDYDLKPDPETGWSPARSAQLGESILYPLWQWCLER